MAIMIFLTHVVNGAILLLFAVRAKRIGIERLWSNRIRPGLGENTVMLQLPRKGVALGIVMQGASVVRLMISGMVGSGEIPLSPAVAMTIGADLGSALAVRFLTLPSPAIGPLAVLLRRTALSRWRCET